MMTVVGKFVYNFRPLRLKISKNDLCKDVQDLNLEMQL